MLGNEAALEKLELVRARNARQMGDSLDLGQNMLEDPVKDGFSADARTTYRTYALYLMQSTTEDVSFALAILKMPLLI